MKKLTFLTFFLLTSILINAQSKPNIILIFADDHGYGDVGYHGNSEIPTPNLDSIAKNGVAFSAGYVTSPVCGPSRAGLLTGKYQQRFGVEFNAPFAKVGQGNPKTIPLNQKLIGQYLKESGYQTAWIGKMHSAENEAKYNPKNRGFDYFFGFIKGGVNYISKKNKKNKRLKGRNLYKNFQKIEENEYLTDAFAREAIGFIERNKNRPFFLYLPFNAVHGPLEAPQNLIKKYSHLQPKRRQIAAAMLDSLDANIGRILAKLRAEKLEENTLIFYFSDNGGHHDRELPAEQRGNQSKNTPLRGKKGEMYEGGIRIPACLQWKGKITSPQTYKNAVITLDILPTILAAIGKKIPKNLDGVNLLPFLNGKNKGTPHEFLFWRQNDRHRFKFAVRNQRWKLVDGLGEGKIELFDLQNDKEERKNLLKAKPQIAKNLRDKFDNWAKDLSEPLW